jgi:hypothetical protein
MTRDESGEGPFVYHRVSPDLRGSVLYPLNQLRDVYPDLYESRRQSYATREDIAALRIPPLGNCLWNDVLHLTPVHPQALKAALGLSGHSLPEEWSRWFEVDAALLPPAATVVYENRLPPLWSGHFDVEDASSIIGSECVAFEPCRLAEYAGIREPTSSYFARVQPGEPIMYFLSAVHVFYKGTIDLESPGVRIIEV